MAGEEPRPKNRTRREIAIQLGLSAAALSEIVWLKGKEWQLPKDIDAESLKQIQKDMFQEHAPGARAYSETTLETVLFLMGTYIAGLVFNKLGIRDGNAAIGDASDAKARMERLSSLDIEEVLSTIVIAPFMEEVTMRLLPAQLYTPNDKKLHWEVGIPTSFLFAAAHNFTRTEGGSMTFSTKRIPATQFFGGLFYWYLMKTRGFSHAVLAHAQTNAAWVLASALEKRFKKAEKSDAAGGT